MTILSQQISPSGTTVIIFGIPNGIPAAIDDVFSIPIIGFQQSSTLNATLTTEPNLNAASGNALITNDNQSSPVIVQNVLPVKLMYFNATKEGALANLSWATTEEVDSDHFEIQHSLNTKSWVGIGEVISNGESKVMQSYTFTHKNPGSGNNYYRLKMVDKDATFAYSRIQNVEFEGDLITVYPNPVVDMFFLKGLDSGKADEISLINSSGIVVYKASRIPASGIIVRSLVNGIYLIRITKENGSLVTRKIVVNK